MGEKEVKLSMKLLVDTKANKVLFAEVDKDFVDFLFHMLSLPLGTVVKLLAVEHMVGSLGDLYKSVEALNSDYVQPNVTKDAVLKSSSASIGHPLLLLNDAQAANNNDTITKNLYLCNSKPSSHYYFSDAPGTPCPSCSSTLSLEMTYVAPESFAGDLASSSGGYVKGVVTYMVMDNLEVKPMSTISALTLINMFHVKDVSSLVEKHVKVGFMEGISILRASLESRSVLTTVFLVLGNKT